MKRIIMWIGAAIILLTILGHVVPAMADNFEAPVAQREAAYLNKSFEATGASPTSFLIHDYSTVNQRFMSSSELLKLAERLSTDLQLMNVTAGKRVGQNEHILQLSGTWSNHITVFIVLSSFHMTDGMPDSTVLVLRAQSDTGNLSELLPHMSAIENQLQDQRIPVNLDAYITGYIKPRLSKEETNQLITKAFEAVEAKHTEGLTSELVTSISGYSPEGPTYIMSKTKMNLQVALHWDGYNQHTNVIVGTPIIVDPY